MSPAVLRNKVNPNCSTHHLTLAEADELMTVTGDHRILAALAAEQGYTLARIDAQADAASVIASQLRATAAQGRLAVILEVALSDGKLSRNEAAAMSDAGAAVQAAIVELMSCAWREATNA